jgi:tetratricopeptide (TPR) repeat protein
MARPAYPLALLLVLAFSFATGMEPKIESAEGLRSDSTGLLTALMGDGRRLFANHFFEKADTYFHSGAYPSIFDQANPAPPGQMSDELKGKEEHHDEDEHEHAAKYTGRPLDWLDRFGQHFYPSTHTHLDEGGARGPEGAGVSTDVREILPWLKLAAELDPNRIESYTVAAFWLRQMKRFDEAQEFLREGWRANPNSYAILLELGRVYEARNDDERARNVWEYALKKWRQVEGGESEPDNFGLSQIDAHLARLEERHGNFAKAVQYLKELKTVSPNPAEVQKRIDEIEKR